MLLIQMLMLVPEFPFWVTRLGVFRGVDGILDVWYQRARFRCRRTNEKLRYNTDWVTKYTLQFDVFVLFCYFTLFVHLWVIALWAGSLFHFGLETTTTYQHFTYTLTQIERQAGRQGDRRTDKTCKYLLWLNVKMLLQRVPWAGGFRADSALGQMEKRVLFSLFSFGGSGCFRLLYTYTLVYRINVMLQARKLYK